MSNDFSAVAFSKYQGATARFPVKLPQGVAPPPNQVPPSVVPLTINWNVYWQLAGQPSAVGVSVNIQAASVQASILDRIASVKIDNTGSSASVYVQFPDTGDVVNCPPNTAVTFPCLTNLLSCNIIALGLSPGFIPSTRIFLYNVNLPPAVDAEVNSAISLWKASPTITRGNTILNTNYGAPALGDQMQASSQILISGGNIVNLWGTPYASGFITLTYLEMVAAGCFATGPNQSAIMKVYSDGVAGILVQPVFVVRGGLTGLSSDFVNIMNATGLQVKLDATQAWHATMVAGVGGGGTIQLFSAFAKTEF